MTTVKPEVSGTTCNLGKTMICLAAISVFFSEVIKYQLKRCVCAWTLVMIEIASSSNLRNTGPLNIVQYLSFCTVNFNGKRSRSHKNVRKIILRKETILSLVTNNPDQFTY